jgi:hypothetical protein
MRIIAVFGGEKTKPIPAGSAGKSAKIGVK